MSAVVFKFAMPARECDISLPDDAQVIKVASQYDDVTLWVLLDPTAPTRSRRFRAYATGEPIDEGGRYVGTAFVDDLVWHVFQQPPLPGSEAGEA